MQAAVPIDVKPLQEKIDKMTAKKQDAIDLMLEGIISKDDLKDRVELYDKEIEELSVQIANNKNLGLANSKQLEQIKKFIAQMNSAENIDTDSFEVYNTMLKKMIVYANSTIDYYLACIPFGLRMTYEKHHIPHTHSEYTVHITDCEVIS